MRSICILLTWLIIARVYWKNVFTGSTNITDRYIKMNSLVQKCLIDQDVSLEYSDQKGFYYNTINEISKRKSTFRIPADIILSPYDDFPFKSFIVDILVQIPEIQRDVRNPSSFYLSLIISALHLIMQTNLSKVTLVKSFPQLYDNYTFWVDSNYGCHEYIYSLPGDGFYDAANMWTRDEIEYFQDITFGQLGYRKLEQFYDKFIQALHHNNSDISQFLINEVFVSK